MAMNIHQEARRRQMHMDRVCEARKRMALCDDNTQQSIEASINGQGSSEPLSCTDQGQFYQTRSVHVWTGPERNRRSYDRSREGPVMGQSWRALEREMNFRQKSLSGAHYNMAAACLGGFQPIDVAFPRK